MMPKLCAAGICLALSLLLAPFAVAQDPGDALRQAASAGDVAKVKELLAAGVDVNAANNYGGTALAYACDKGRTEVVNLLLEHGADVNVKDRFYNSTPLIWAVGNGHVEIVRALLAKGAQGEAEALVYAASDGQTEVVKLILERGKVGPEDLSNALVAATQEEKKEMVAFLEAAGAKPPATVAVDPAVLKGYEGIYEGPSLVVTVALKDGKLTATAEGGTLTLAATDPVTFRAEEFAGIKVTFQVEAEKVTGLTIHRGESSTPLKKRETP